MKLGLIFSNDWELYGNGSGDYFEIQHKPLRELMDVAAEHEAKITVMAEVGQQWAHQRIRDQNPWAGEIADAWESILIEVIDRGFDVQLHLHPQWLNAEYKNNKWYLDMDHWAVSSLEPEVMEKTFTDGKSYLDKLLKSTDSKYECIAFRAGAYCVEPSEILVKKLLKTGLLADSSVTKGLRQRNRYDFSDAHSNYMPWITSRTNIKYSNGTNEGLLEIPIHSYIGFDSLLLNRLFRNQFFNIFHFGVLKHEEDVKWQLERQKYIQERYPKRSGPSSSRAQIAQDNSNLFSAKIVSTRVVQLDYDILSPGEFLGCLKKILKTNRSWSDNDCVLPIMSSGHTKNIPNVRNFKKILEMIDNKLEKRIEYITLSKAVRSWRESL